MNNSKLKFSKYLYSKKKIILLFLIFIVIFLTIFFLCNIPFMALVYPIILCIIVGIVFMIFDYKKENEKYKTLENIKTLSFSMIENLPIPKDESEKDYQEIISLLKEELKKIKDTDNFKFNNMVEYYTIWAHQIKTPISAMKLKIKNEDSEFARQMDMQLLSIEQYVQMVLTFLRIDSDSTDYVFKKYVLDDVIRPTIKKLAPIFIEKKIKLSYESIEDEVLTDEKWLSFVIEQILSNSLKYTKEEGCIKIYMYQKDILCIEDNGIGIAKDDLPRIFEKGYTGYNGREERNASGIGLFLCKKICDELNIKISINSEIAKGTKIFLDLSRYDLHVE